MFVVDDLVGWLIGRVADAGYQKLIRVVRGSDQFRALRLAVVAAVEATVGEIGLSGGEEPDGVAKQINKAFGKQKPVALPPGVPTLLEALQAGIAGQLSVVDDAGQPAVSLPGVPVSEVADKLTVHLVREIMTRGSQPGPLTPLADQLNHDLTHLQGQRIEGMLAQLLDRLGGAPAPPGRAAGPVGWPLAEVADPFALEVHRAVESDVPEPGLPALPVYVPREHDAALAKVVADAAAGAGGIAVLVGGSSTGKTRAYWQALELLRSLEPEWRLWHPIDAQEALAGLPDVGPRTVVWLNEAQRYLDTPDGTGERVAAGLRKLLRDRDRGPVLVLATLWPEFWGQLTARPPGSADPHAQARELLAGHNIQVPAAFTDEQLRELEEAGDPRLAQAAAGSHDGQVIQYLAGAPDLLDRYYIAPPAARALIDAAMDARRLGMRPALPRAFLKVAAPGYLTDADWDLLPDDWLEQALSYTAVPCKGVRGPVTPVRFRPGPGAPDSTGGGPACQLADYLDQHGRRARRELIPPAAFWAAAATDADPADLGILGDAAYARGLYCDAARLYKQATSHGDPEAGVRLVRWLHTLDPGDQRPAGWAAVHAGLDDPDAVARLLRALRDAGATSQVTTLLDRDPAAHASPDDPDAVADLLAALHDAGATSQFTTLASRAASHASLDNPYAVASLLVALHNAGATSQVTTLLDRDPAAHASVDDPEVGTLIYVLRGAGATSQFTTLASRAAAHASVDDPYAVADLLKKLRGAGATSQVTTLASRAASHASLDDPAAVASLLDELRQVGAHDQVTILASRAATHASLDDPAAVAKLLDALREAGATSQVTTLASRAATHASLDDPAAVARLLDALREAGADDQVTTLASRAASHASLDDPAAVARLFFALRELGADDQVTTLISRAAAHTGLDDPAAVASLLRTLRMPAAADQVTTLLDRDPAAHASLDHPEAVASLLDELREAGAADQVTTLLDRDPAAHASLDDPHAVARLFFALSAAGATSQVTTLLDRDPAAHASLDHPEAVTYLYHALRAAGATSQITTLLDRAAAHARLDYWQDVALRLLPVLREEKDGAPAAELLGRLPGAGLFEQFRLQQGRKEQFRFGRDADGAPARRWAWTDLD